MRHVSSGSRVPHPPHLKRSEREYAAGKSPDDEDDDGKRKTKRSRVITGSAVKTTKKGLTEYVGEL